MCPWSDLVGEYCKTSRVALTNTLRVMGIPKTGQKICISTRTSGGRQPHAIRLFVTRFWRFISLCLRFSFLYHRGYLRSHRALFALMLGLALLLFSQSLCGACRISGMGRVDQLYPRFVDCSVTVDVGLPTHFRDVYQLACWFFNCIPGDS